MISLGRQTYDIRKEDLPANLILMSRAATHSMATTTLVCTGAVVAGAAPAVSTPTDRPATPLKVNGGARLVKVTPIFNPRRTCIIL